MNYWSWGGKYIGQCSRDILYSHFGTPIRKFFNNTLYNFEGEYIGEIMNSNRIIVNIQKKHLRISPTCKPYSRCGTSCSDYCAYAMCSGYEDFKIK